MGIYPKNKENFGNTKNNSGSFKPGQPTYLVCHYTAGGDGLASAKFLFGAHEPASSAHFVVERDGSVYQLADTKLITWHAGKSFWRGVNYLNSFAVGIELANWGYWRPGIGLTAEQAVQEGWIKAKHKNGGAELLWEPYSEQQINSAVELATWVMHEHPSIKEIVGHDDIAPSRKTDPGPAFPMSRFVGLVTPRSVGSPAAETDNTVVAPTGKVDAEMTVNATSLNVREGAGTHFSIIAGLKRKATVKVLNEKDDWSFVQYTSGKSTKQGWVLSQYLSH